MMKFKKYLKIIGKINYLLNKIIYSKKYILYLIKYKIYLLKICRIKICLTQIYHMTIIKIYILY